MRLPLLFCLLVSGSQAGLLRWSSDKAGGSGGLFGGLANIAQGIMGIGGKILGDDSRGSVPNEKDSANQESDRGSNMVAPEEVREVPRTRQLPSESYVDKRPDNQVYFLEEPVQQSVPNPDIEKESDEGKAPPNLEEVKKSELANAANILSNPNDGNYNKTKARKAKVTSSQSIRILVPGNKNAGPENGSYSRNSASVGQNTSKHKSEARSATAGVQRGDRVDVASVGSEREVGVDAAQDARVNTDSSGMSEILLTQKSVAQKKTKQTEARTSAHVPGGSGIGAFSASSASRAGSSGTSRYSDLAQESYTRH